MNTTIKAHSSAPKTTESLDSCLADQFAYSFAYKDSGDLLQTNALLAYRDLLITRVIWQKDNLNPEYVAWANTQVDRLISLVGDEDVVVGGDE